MVVAMSNMFDVGTRTNCCNCISIVVYLVDNTDYSRYSRYLTTLLASIENVKKFLPDWIIRLYIDKSVFEIIYKVEQTSPKNEECSQNIGTEYRKTLDTIFSSENCEIYVTFCEKLIDGTLNISKLRNLRFSGFFDKNVKVNASREADGLITQMDCYNLKNFSCSSNEILMIINMLYLIY